MNLPTCQFIALHPQKPWTRSPISMLCLLQNNLKSKVPAGLYILGNKTCFERNETTVTRSKNFKYDPINPIHGLFKRKKESLKSTLEMFFDTILDMNPHRLHDGYYQDNQDEYKVSELV